MSAYEVYDESKYWRVISVPVPNVRAELYKALHRAEQEYERVHGREASSDDAFEIDVTDDAITIRIEVPKKES